MFAEPVSVSSSREGWKNGENWWWRNGCGHERALLWSRGRLVCRIQSSIGHRPVNAFIFLRCGEPQAISLVAVDVGKLRSQFFDCHSLQCSNLVCHV